MCEAEVARRCRYGYFFGGLSGGEGFELDFSVKDEFGVFVRVRRDSASTAPALLAPSSPIRRENVCDQRDVKW